jgi:hypothetical protein
MILVFQIILHLHILLYYYLKYYLFQGLKKIVSPYCGFDAEHMKLPINLADKPNIGLTRWWCHGLV